MAEQSPRMAWTYPSSEDDPWYSPFQDFVIAADGSGFAHREDRSIIWAGGGTISWDLGTETLDWTGEIRVYSPLSGKLMSVDAGSIVGWADGEIVYLELTRLALANVTKALQKSTALPSNDDVMAFAVRIGDAIYFRTGISLSDGESVIGVAPSPSGGTATDVNAVHVNVASEISGVTAKGTPVSADFLLIEDSADSNNKKSITVGDLPDTDPDAIHDNVPGEIAAITPKGSPTGSDRLLIEDANDSNNKKSITIGNLPFGSSDLRGAAIIVGSTTNGDTISNCDFLDTGNGAQLEAAIQAADDLTYNRDVWIRPGLYDLGVGGGPAGGIAIPAGVKVHGAGRGSVTVQTKPSGDLTAFYVGFGAELEDVLVNVTRPTGNGTGGDGAVVLGDDQAECRRVIVDFLDSGSYDATDATELNYGGAFFVSSGSTRIRLIDCGVGLGSPAPSLMVLTGGSEILAGFFVDAPIASVAADIERCRVVGSDRAYFAARTTRFNNCEFDAPFDKAFYVNGSDAADSQVTDCWGVMSASQATEIGIHVRQAPRVDVSNNRLTVTGAPAIGVYFESSDDGIISGNRGTGWVTAGVSLNSNADDNIVIGNQLGTVNDLGAGNDVAHNK